MKRPGKVVSVQRLIAATPLEIFDLLADPRRHRLFDGSDTVRDPVRAPERLSMGATFQMAMQFGFPYRMTNTVIEFEEGRRIAWQTRPALPLGRYLGGRVWRYDLEPAEGGTLVRETWDLTAERGIRGLPRIFTLPFRREDLVAHTRKNMERTLERLGRAVTSS